MIVKKRATALFLALAAIAVVAIACGTDSNGADAAAGASDTANASATTVQPPVTSDGVADNSESAGTTTASGGLDTACVELVLGRTVTGFGDITEAERTRIFSECSAGGRGGAGIAGAGPGGFGGRFGGVGFDPECVATALGTEATDLTEMTPEQRTAVFEACGGADLAGGGRFGGVALDPECVATALGTETTDLTEMTPEERTAVFEACGGADFAAGGGRLFGQDGRPEGAGGPGAGGLGALFDSACIEDALSQAGDDITQLTPEDRQRLFSECAPEGGLGGRPGYGTRGFGGRQSAPVN